MEITYSRHALEQMPCRNLSRADIAVVAAWGTRVRRTGVTFVFLGRRQLARMPDGGRACARLEGTVMVIDGARVITCYRNWERGLKDARKKARYDRHPEHALFGGERSPGYRA
jgi:hypothetical protein